MPILPTIDIQDTNTQTQTGNPVSAKSEIYRQLSNLGGAVADIATDWYVKEQRQKDEDALSNAKAERKLGSSKYYSDTKPRIDPLTDMVVAEDGSKVYMHDHYTQWTSKTDSEVVKNLPSENAIREYKRWAQDYDSGFKVGLEQEVYNDKEKARKINFAGIDNINSAVINNSPDPTLEANASLRDELESVWKDPGIEHNNKATRALEVGTKTIGVAASANISNGHLTEAMDTVFDSSVPVAEQERLLDVAFKQVEGKDSKIMFDGDTLRAFKDGKLLFEKTRDNKKLGVNELSKYTSQALIEDTVGKIASYASRRIKEKGIYSDIKTRVHNTNVATIQGFKQAPGVQSSLIDEVATDKTLQDPERPGLAYSVYAAKAVSENSSNPANLYLSPQAAALKFRGVSQRTISKADSDMAKRGIVSTYKAQGQAAMVDLENGLKSEWISTINKINSESGGVDFLMQLDPSIAKDYQESVKAGDVSPFVNRMSALFARQGWSKASPVPVADAMRDLSIVKSALFGTGDSKLASEKVNQVIHTYGNATSAVISAVAERDGSYKELVPTINAFSTRGGLASQRDIENLRAWNKAASSEASLSSSAKKNLMDIVSSNEEAVKYINAITDPLPPEARVGTKDALINQISASSWSYLKQPRDIGVGNSDASKAVSDIVGSIKKGKTLIEYGKNKTSVVPSEKVKDADLVGKSIRSTLTSKAFLDKIDRNSLGTSVAGSMDGSARGILSNISSDNAMDIVSGIKTGDKDALFDLLSTGNAGDFKTEYNKDRNLYDVYFESTSGAKARVLNKDGSPATISPLGMENPSYEDIEITPEIDEIANEVIKGRTPNASGKGSGWDQATIDKMVKTFGSGVMGELDNLDSLAENVSSSIKEGDESSANFWTTKLKEKMAELKIKNPTLHQAVRKTDYLQWRAYRATINYGR